MHPLLIGATLIRISLSLAASIRRSANVSPDVVVCTDTLDSPQGCTTISVVSDACIDLNDTLSDLDKRISSASIPGGFVCTFFEDHLCFASGTGNSNTDSEVVLTQGAWNLSDVPGLSGPEDFNDLTSSFACSPA
ncbi:hypothetical protein FB45DRAFT_1065897 [Roridomyces roridus]|uniref:Uncharacterized protein n=1 Tax=Roridomyces roridus TaxID=1738132 RepID=A0AAD7B649_9AGAR|nr:hypothetical protein FB45DRAFT_1065897 [Roridomyces roridus]